MMVFNFSYAYCGQEGSGGNICPVVLPSGEIRFKVLEELQFPDLVNSNLADVRFPLEDSASPYSYHDLTATPAGEIAKKILFSLNPEFRLKSVLENYYFRLKSIVVVSDSFAHSFSGAFSEIPQCNPQDAVGAIVSWPNGLVMLSRPAWNSLYVESQVILLIHETVRFAKMWSSELRGLSEKDLQELVMLIYSGKLN